MLLNYFDFKDNIEVELDKLLEFVDLPRVRNDTVFNRVYNLYYYFFTREQVEAVEKLCQNMCDWLCEELGPYFAAAREGSIQSDPHSIEEEIGNEEEGEDAEF